MGLPLYGRTWKLQDPEVNGIGAPAIGVGSELMVYWIIIKYLISTIRIKLGVI